MWKINRRKLIFALTLASTIWLLGGVPQVQATSALSQLLQLKGDILQGSGNNFEYMINLVNDPTVPCGKSGDVRRCADAGDLFIEGFNIQNIEDLKAGGTTVLGANGLNELTALAAIKVISQTRTPTGTGSRFDQVLGPVTSADLTAAVASGQMSSTLAGIIGAWAPGSIAAIYDDGNATGPLTTDTYTRLFNSFHLGPDDCDSTLTGADIGVGSVGGAPAIPGGCKKKEENLLTTVRGGTQLFQIGFTGLRPDEFLIANDNGGPKEGNDIKVLRAINPPAQAGHFDGGLNITANFTTLSFGLVDTLVGQAQFALSGSELGIGRANTPFDLFSQADIVFQPIPEPSSLTLILLGTAALGFTTVRRWKGRP